MNPTLVLGLALAVAAPAKKDDPKKPAAIAGDWVVERSVSGGRERPLPDGGLVLTFTPDGRFVVKEGADAAKEEGTYKADASKDPAHLDILPPERKKLPPVPGIYELAGNTLTLCMARREGGERPAAFDAPAGAQFTLFTLKRVQKK
jgi:uncharacterized protein (TIGR03067 family)